MLHMLLHVLWLTLLSKIIWLIGTWRTTQENSTTTILYESGLGWLIRWTICGVGVASLVVFGLASWSRWRKRRLLRDCNYWDQHLHIGILWKGLVESLCNHTSEVWYCVWSTHAWLGSKFFGTFTRIVVKVYNLCRVKTNQLAVLTVKSGLDPHMIN